MNRFQAIIDQKRKTIRHAEERRALRRAGLLASFDLGPPRRPANDVADAVDMNIITAERRGIAILEARG